MESSTSAVTTTYKPLKGMHVPQTSWTNRMEEVCACGRCWEFETPSAAIAPSPKTTKSSSRLPLNAKKSSPWSMSVRKRHSFSGANRGAVMDSTSNNLGTPEPYSTKLRRRTTLAASTPERPKTADIISSKKYEPQLVDDHRLDPQPLMTGFVEQKSRLPTLAHTFEDSFETLAYAKSFSVLNGSTSISSSLVSDQKSDASKSGQGFTISSLLGERQY